MHCAIFNHSMQFVFGTARLAQVLPVLSQVCSQARFIAEDFFQSSHRCNMSQKKRKGTKPIVAAAAGPRPEDQEEPQTQQLDHKTFLIRNRESNSVNANIFRDLVTPAIQHLQHQPHFSDWNSPAQLVMGTDSAAEVAACMQGFNLVEAKRSLANCCKYTCAVPAPLFAPYYSPTPGVRLNKAKIMQVVNDDSMTFQTWPMQTIAIRTGEDLEHTEFTCISPEEVRIAMFGNIARRSANGDLSNEDLLKIRRNMWCIPTEFIIEDSEERRFFKALSCRREAQISANMCRRSASQVVDEVISVWTSTQQPPNEKAKQRPEQQPRMTIKKLHDLYKKHCGDTEGDDNEDGEDCSLNMNYNCIRDALCIHNRIKTNPILNHILQNAEDVLMERSPFFNISNLALIIKKAKREEELEFFMNAMYDTCLCEDHRWTARTLGMKSSGFLQILSFQLSIKKHILESRFKEIVYVPSDEHSKIKDCLSSFQLFRETIGFKSGPKAATNPDKQASFLAGMTEAGEQLFLTCAEFIYSRKWDSRYRTACEEKEYAKGVMNSSPIKEIFESIQHDASVAAVKVSMRQFEEGVQAEQQEEDIKKKLGMDEKPSEGSPEKPGKDDDDPGTHIGTILAGEELWSKDFIDKPDLAQDISTALAKCIEIVDRDCKFIVAANNDSESVIAAKIRECDSIAECTDKRTAVVYCVGSSGSAQKNPSNNPPSFRVEHHERLTKGMLNSREADGVKAQCINPFDYYYTFDMKREGNHANFATVFTHNKTKMAMTKPKKFLIIYEQSSILQRAKRVRGFASVTHRENQGFVIISRNTFGADLEIRGRLHLQGDNRSQNFYPVKAHAYDHQFEFRCFPKDREAIIGKEHTFGLSGSAYNAETNFISEPDKKEPCFFFENPHELGMELIHAHGWQRIIHLTAGNGWLAIAGMAMRVPGVYVCFTDTHAKELRQHLARVVFMLMQDPCSNFYDPALVSLVQEAEEHLGKDKEGTPPAKKDSKDPWASSAKKNKKNAQEGRIRKAQEGRLG